MEAIASARSRRVLPERLAMPYSVATYWIIVRGAEIVLPPGMVARILLLRSPSFVTREELMQMKPLPPLERYAPSRKSIWPPTPESWRVPVLSAFS